MSITNPQTLKQLGCELWWPGEKATANSPKAITAAGNATQILPFPGAGIGLFDGTGDYLLNTDIYQFTTGLTIEFLCRFITVGVVQTPLHLTTANSYGIQFQLSATNYISAYVSSADASWNINSTASSTTVISANTWYHVALVWTGTTYTLYINGITERTFLSSVAPASSSKLVIGGRSTNALGYDQLITGNLSELRISNIARYTSAFTPPRYQHVPDGNTMLLLHFDRNDTTFIDSSIVPKTITAYGDVKQLCSPVNGGGVVYFDGGASYLTLPYGADFVFGSSDWALEFYIKFNSKTLGCQMIAYLNGNTSGSAAVMVYADATNLNFCVATPTAYYIYVPMSQLDLGTYYHFAFVRSGSTIKVYKNGVDVGTPITGISTLNDYSGVVYIGRAGWGGTTYISGYLSELRLTKNISRYTGSTIAVPTTPFKPDIYTKLLLHFDGVGQVFADYSDTPVDNGFAILPAGVTVTPVGTFAVQKMKDGRNIYNNPGGATYISLTDNDAWTCYINDFTICAWVRYTSISLNNTLLCHYQSVSSAWEIYWRASDTQLRIIGFGNNTFIYSCPFTPTINTWYHIAVIKSNTLCLMYINGILQTVTITTAWSNLINLAAPLLIGTDLGDVMHGNIKDLMLIKGTALSYNQINQIIDETFIY